MSSFDLKKIKDFTDYAPNLLKIKTFWPDPNYPEKEVERIIPFVLNNVQLRLHALFEHLLKTIGYVRIIVLKARREGVSTYVEGRLFHKVHTTPNTHSFIVAHDKDGLNTIFEMSKLFYESLPKTFRPMKRYSSKKELVFENPNDRDRFSNPGLRSRIEVQSANKFNPLRSGGYTCGHLSEVAFYPDPESLVPAVIPTVPDSLGSILVLESTANGRGGYLHEEWLKAKDGESNFTPIFFSWLEFKEYSRKWDYADEESEVIEHLDDEEEALTKKHNALPKQIHWRRHKLMDLQGDIDLFHQEYPVDDIEAFISSGRPYFARQKLRSLLNKCVPPEFVGDVTNFGLVENADGPLFVWERPEKDGEYVLGVDVGDSSLRKDSADLENIKKGDPVVIEVLRVPKDSPYIVQVAEFRDWLDPVVLAGKVIFLARYYNDAMVSPEINKDGLTLLNELKEHYWNIYRWQYFDRFGKYTTNKLGWDTNVTTKPLLCGYTAACINRDLLVIRSEDLIDEMLGFVKNFAGSGEADSSGYDDRVMAFMIALFTLAHSSQLSASILKELDVFTSPIVSEEKPHLILSPHEVDASFLPNAPLIEKRGYFSGEQSWLNY